MSIVVNGTANFFFGREETHARDETYRTDIPQKIPAIGAEQPAIGVEKKLRFDPDYDDRPGYQSDFLKGFNVSPPEAPSSEVLKDGELQKILRYHHYSLVMHKKRRLAMWAAANVDYNSGKRFRDRKEFGTDTWKPDPRIPIEAQIEDLEFYKPAAKFDRGHLVRRDDVAWGEIQEEEYGNSDSFHWTNCTPQHEGFNRDIANYHGLWGQLEHHISKQAGFVQNRLIVFAGPVLDPEDPVQDFGSGIDVQIPVVFWKVVIAVEDISQNPTLRAYGFLLDQTDAINRYGWERRFSVGKFSEQQMSLAEISKRSRVTFPNVVLKADPLQNVPTESRGRSLRTLGDIKLR